MTGRQHGSAFVDPDFLAIQHIGAVPDFLEQTFLVKHSAGADTYNLEIGTGDTRGQGLVDPLAPSGVDVSVTSVRHVGGEHHIMAIFFGQIASNQALAGGTELHVNNQINFFHFCFLDSEGGAYPHPLSILQALASV